MSKKNNLAVPIMLGIAAGAVVGTVHSTMMSSSGRTVKKKAERAVRSMREVANDISSMVK